MIVKCHHCNTVAGRECTNTFRGPRAKPRWAKVCSAAHVEPFGRCDVCQVTAKAIHKNYVVEWDSAEVPEWLDLATGRMVRRYTDAEVASMNPPRGQSTWGADFDARQEAQRQENIARHTATLKEHKIHVCPECATSLRRAQEIAFDLCLSQREGLNAGKSA